MQRVVPLFVLSLVALAGLSGCIGTDTPPEPSAASDTAAAFDTTYAFTDDFGLVEQVPAGETRRAALGDFYTNWMTGCCFPEWSSAPLEAPLLVEGNVTLRFWITADTVVTSTPGIFPDFVVYFGTTESLAAVVSPNNLDPLVADNTVVRAGDAIPVLASFTLPPGGVTIPAGTGVRVVTAPVMMETDANDLYILYGSEEHPSGVSFTARTLDRDPGTGTPQTTEHPLRLVAGSFLHGEEIEDVNVVTRTFTVTANTTAVLVDLDFHGDTPFPDMDLYVFGPDGQEVALSVTPGADEAVHLYRANLDAVGPGTWSWKVVNYVTVGAEFTVTETLVTAA